MDMPVLPGMGGYGYDYQTAMALGGIVMALTFIVFIAAIVAIIVGYKFYLGKDRSRRKTKLGQLFNFDHYYIDKTLKVFYLISVVAITAGSISIIISSLAAGILGFFAGIIIAAVVFLLAQLLCRITFESSLLFVQMALDTRAIRTEVAGHPSDEEYDQPHVETASTQAQPTAVPPTAQAATKQQPTVVPPVTIADAAAKSAGSNAPVPPAGVEVSAEPAPTAEAVPEPEPAPVHRPSANEWDCPLCGTHVTEGKFCFKCGTPRP